MTCMTLLPDAGRNGAHAARGAPGRTRRLILAFAAQPGGTPEGEGLQRQSLGRSRRAKSTRRRRTACAPPFSSPGNARASGHKIFRRSQVRWAYEPFNNSYAPGPKKFDFDINEISVTAQRATAVTFSTSYYDVQQALVALKSGPIVTR